MRATLRPLLSTAAVMAILASPAAARAQQPLDPIQVSARTTQADKFDARAAEYEATGSRRQWAKAAALRETAAALRAPEDPRGFRSLQVAALVRHALRERPAAAALMERAANQALARGDVFSAATAYVDVAYLAAELGDADRTREFVSKGALLMHSPLLSAPERELLRRAVAQAGASPVSVALLERP
jgi:hypothetical protein